MKQFVTFRIVIFIAAGWIISSIFAKSFNLVPNSSFEEVTLSIPPINFMPAHAANEDDPPEYKVYIPNEWKIVSGYSRGYLPKDQGWGVAEYAHTGKRSIFLKNAPAFPAWYSKVFLLEPNTAYLAEVYIDAEGLWYHDYVRIIFSILDKNDNCLGYEQIVASPVDRKPPRIPKSGKLDWRHKQVYIRPRENQAKMRIIIRVVNSGCAYVDDISVCALSPKEARELEPPYIQKIPILETVKEQLRVKATGFFRVEQVDGIWWLIDPEGLLTWSIGIQSMGNVLWENPSLSKLIEEKYGGNQSLYLEDQIPRLQQWNFTTSGSWSGPVFYELNKRLIAKGQKPFPSFHFIGFTTVGDQEYSLRNHDGDVNDFGEHAMVDPFNPNWRIRAEEKVKDITSLYKGIPWLVGYFVDNEINFKRSFTGFLHSKYCRRELVEWLNKLYRGRIVDLNKKWSTENKYYQYSNFDEIKKDIPDQEPTPACEKDLRLFVRYLMKNYIDFTIETIRKYDKDHLIISNRFMLSSKTSALEQVNDFVDLFSKYDIVCVNLYAKSGGSYTPDQMTLLQYLYEKTQRPVLIGEWSFHSNESNIPLDRWGGKIVSTMKERCEAYRRAMVSWSYLPYMVGAHFYKWCNGYGPTGNYRGRNSGIVDDQNEPYQPFVDTVTKTNYDVLHARRVPERNVDDFEYLGR